MSQRSIASIILAVIVAIEIFLFVNEPAPTKRVMGPVPIIKTVIDKEQQEIMNTKYFTIIGATIALGGIVTFSLPNKKQ